MINHTVHSVRETKEIRFTFKELRHNLSYFSDVKKHHFQDVYCVCQNKSQSETFKYEDVFDLHINFHDFHDKTIIFTGKR